MKNSELIVLSNSNTSPKGVTSSNVSISYSGRPITKKPVDTRFFSSVLAGLGREREPETLPAALFGR